MKKKLLAIVLAAAMVFTLLPVVALAVTPQNPYSVTKGGSAATSGSGNDYEWAEDETLGWSLFIYKTGLTVSNNNINTKAAPILVVPQENADLSVTFANVNTSFVLIDATEVEEYTSTVTINAPEGKENTIMANEDTAPVVVSTCSLKLSGPGTFETGWVLVGGTDISAISSMTEDAYEALSPKNITLEGCTVAVDSMFGFVVVGNIEIEESDVTIEKADNGQIGLMAFGDITITESTMDIAEVNGIMSSFGKIEIKDDSVIDISGSSGLVSSGDIVINDSELNIEEMASGLIAYEGSIIITESDVSVTEGEESQTETAGVTASGNLEITESELDINTKAMGLTAADIIITESDVSVASLIGSLANGDIIITESDVSITESILGSAAVGDIEITKSELNIEATASGVMTADEKNPSDITFTECTINVEAPTGITSTGNVTITDGTASINGSITVLDTLKIDGTASVNVKTVEMDSSEEQDGSSFVQAAPIMTKKLVIADTITDVTLIGCGYSRGADGDPDFITGSVYFIDKEEANSLTLGESIRALGSADMNADPAKLRDTVTFNAFEKGEDSGITSYVGEDLAKVVVFKPVKESFLSKLISEIFEYVSFKKTSDDIMKISIFTIIIEFILSILDMFRQ